MQDWESLCPTGHLDNTAWHQGLLLAQFVQSRNTCAKWRCYKSSIKVTPQN